MADSHDFGGPAELIDQLRKTPLILQALVHGLPVATANTRPNDDDWSVPEIIGHLIDAERRAITRIAQIRSETTPVLNGYDQNDLVETNDYRSLPSSQIIEEFEQLRLERIDALEHLTDKAWFRTGRLGELGVVTLLQITAHMCWHDINHLAQIAERRSRTG